MLIAAATAAFNMDKNSSPDLKLNKMSVKLTRLAKSGLFMTHDCWGDPLTRQLCNFKLNNFYFVDNINNLKNKKKKLKTLKKVLKTVLVTPAIFVLPCSKPG